MPEIIEANRRVTCYLKNDLGESRPVDFQPGPNEVETSDWEALLQRKDSMGKYPVRGYVEAGILRKISSSRANAIRDGEERSSADDVVLTPAQAGAQTYGQTKSTEAAVNAAERAHNGDPVSVLREPPTPKRK